MSFVMISFKESKITDLVWLRITQNFILVAIHFKK